MIIQEEHTISEPQPGLVDVTVSLSTAEEPKPENWLTMAHTLFYTRTTTFITIFNERLCGTLIRDDQD